MGNNFAELLQNPRIQALKKFLFQLMEQKYPVHEEIAERIGYCLVTDKDLTALTKLVADVYEIGYMKAVADYRDQLTKLGIKVNITQKSLDDIR